MRHHVGLAYRPSVIGITDDSTDLWLEDPCLYAARVVHGDESGMRVGIGSLVQCKQEVPDDGSSVLSRSRPGRLAPFDRVSLSD